MAGKKTVTKKKKQTKATTQEQSFIKNEALVIVFFLFAVLLFLSNFGLIGAVGKVLKAVQLGLFGVVGYVFPILLFITAVFFMSNKDNPKIWIKIAALFFAVIAIAGIIHELFGDTIQELGGNFLNLYSNQNGGGLLGGFIAIALDQVVKKVGTILILLALLIISCVVITEKSFVSAVKKGSGKVYTKAKDDMAYANERRHIIKEARQISRQEALLRKVQGVDIASTDLSNQ